MSKSQDRFGAVELSPTNDEPLLRPGSASLEAISGPSVSLTLCVVSATELRPMQKSVMSNPMCEISLVLDDGMGRSYQKPHDPRTDHKLMANRVSSTAASIANGILAKTFKTKVVRASLNPLWNMDVDFGDYNAESVFGVLVVVKHIEKMGMVKRDIGHVLISMRELLELKSQPSREKTFTLEATDETNAREAQEGISNRKYGKVTVRFNSYGLPQSLPKAQKAPSLPNYTGLMNENRPTTLSEGSVTHEDDFSGEQKRVSSHHNIQKEIKKLQSFHQTKPLTGETWYAIDAKWITSWLLFVSKHKGQQQFNPGEIDNMPLLADELPDGRFAVRRDLVIKKDFRMINKPSWDFYQAQYGGGPAIEVMVPQDCRDTVAWLGSLQLDAVARVASGYY